MDGIVLTGSVLLFGGGESHTASLTCRNEEGLSWWGCWRGDEKLPADGKGTMILLYAPAICDGLRGRLSDVSIGSRNRITSGID